MKHSIGQQIRKPQQQWPQDRKRSVFTSIPKKGNAKECSNYHTTALISHASKAMLKILQSRLQQHMNRELPDVHAGFRKVRGTRYQIANIPWITEKASVFQKNIYFCFILCTKAFDCVYHNITKNCGKFWDRNTRSPYLPPENLYTGQEATVRNRYGTRYRFKTGKRVCQGNKLSPCLFNIDTGTYCTLDEVPAGSKIQFSSVQYLSQLLELGSQLFETPWMAAHQASLPSTTARAWSNSCRSSPWCHPTISSSVVPFSSCHQSFPASGSFLMTQVFASAGQSIGASASASVFPMNIQNWFPLGLTGLISLKSKGLSRVFSNTTVQKHQFFSTQPSLWSNFHVHTWLLEKP